MVNTEEMKNLNYEQVYAEAEKCMNALEGTEVGLEEALALHARGKALLEICQEKLEAAKQRLEVRAPVAVDSDIVV
jgi:exodeoxyribonuclease VII small subunit